MYGSATPSISVGFPLVNESGWSDKGAVIDRYLRLVVKHHATIPPMLSDIRPETELLAPAQPVPAWLDSIQESIRRSVPDSPDQFVDDGRWLTRDVAEAATDFFNEVGDLLPGPPHIYRSTAGDLVAEFSKPNGSLTSIVSPTFVLLFGVVNGIPVQKRIDQPDGMRRQVEEIMGVFMTGVYGDLDAEG